MHKMKLRKLKAEIVRGGIALFLLSVFSFLLCLSCPAQVGVQFPFGEASGSTATHAALTTGVHGAGASTLATVAQLHAAVTLATSGDVLLGLTGQALSLDTQTANTVLAGRVDAGTALAPTFRALVAADIPALSYEPVIAAAVDWGGKTSLEIPNDNPTMSAVGQLAFDTTQNQLLGYVGSAAAVMASPARHISFTILYNGTSWASLVIPIWQAPLAESVTITTIDATIQGSGAAPALAYNLEERAYAGLASAGTDVLTTDASADADGTESTSFANAGIAAKAHLVFTTGATPETDTVTAITVTVYYTVDRL